MEKLKFTLKNKQYEVEVSGIVNNIATVVVNGETYEIEVDRQVVRQENAPSNNTKPAAQNGTPAKATPAVAAPPSGGGTGFVKSPLPGKILDIFVKPGDKVTHGQTVLCLEAMKMENNINSDLEGVVIAIHAHKGDTVLEGHKIIEIG